MKCIKIQRALVLSFFFSSAVSAEAIDRIEYTLGRLFKDVEAYINGNTASCTPITQADINSGDGTYTITESGEYCLTGNVTGSIVIAANSVCLALGCYTLDAGGAASAISATNQYAINISGGSIVNSSVAGISLTNCTAVEVFNLALIGHADDSFLATSCAEVSVHNINFFNGNRAVELDSCTNFNLASCSFTGFGNCDNFSLVELNSCTFGKVQDIDASTNCVSGIIVIQDCDSITVADVRINNNDSQGGILLYGVCTDCTLTRCQSNGGFFGIAALPSGPFTNLSIIECVCANNHTAYVIENGVCCLVQDCRAINNAFGFVDFSDSLTTTYIGNLAQCSSDTGFEIENGTISLQGLDWISGNNTLISGNDALGARFTNIIAPGAIG